MMEAGASPGAGIDLKQRAEVLQERRRLFAQASERQLAELDAEEREERKEQEKRRKRAALLTAEDIKRRAENADKDGVPAPAEPWRAKEAGGAGTVHGLQAPQYYEMAGVLPSFRHAMDLHPHSSLAATGGALGQIALWSRGVDPPDSKSGGGPEKKQESAADAQQPWHLLHTISSSRPSAKEMVTALTFIPCPSVLRTGDLAKNEIFLASASSHKTIKIWAGVGHGANQDATATEPHGTKAPHDVLSQTVSGAHAVANGAARARKDSAGVPKQSLAMQSSSTRQPRVRLTLVPFTSSPDSQHDEHLADQKEIQDLVSRDVATALGTHHSRVRAEVREHDRKVCVIDVHFTADRRGASAVLQEKYEKGQGNRDRPIEQLAANALLQKEQGGMEGVPLKAREPPHNKHNAAGADQRCETELLAALLSNASDLHSKLRTSGHTQRIRKARIAFVNDEAPGEDAGDQSLASDAADTQTQQKKVEDGKQGAGDEGVRGSGAGKGAGAGGGKELHWSLVATLVDESTPACAALRLAHTDEVACLAYRHAEPAQPLLVSAGGDMLVKLWEVEHVVEEQSAAGPKHTGVDSQGAGDEEDARRAKAAAALLGLRKGRWRCAGVLRGHAARIICVAVGGCRGRLIVSSDNNGELLVWGDAGLVRQRLRLQPEPALLVLPSRPGLAHASSDAPHVRRLAGGVSSSAHPDEPHVPGVRRVEFALLDRLEESWPVRCVALGTRRPMRHHLRVLRELVPSVWPGEDEEASMSLEEHLEAIDTTLYVTAQEAEEWQAACALLKVLAGQASHRCKEPALSDRSVLRQWLRAQELVVDNDITPMLKDLDARRVQSLAELRSLVAKKDSRAVTLLVRTLKQSPVNAAATRRNLEEALEHLESEHARYGADAEHPAARVAKAMGDAPPRVRDAWLQSLRDAWVPIVSSVARAEGALAAACLQGVRRRLALLVPGVEAMALSAAKVTLLLDCPSFSCLLAALSHVLHIHKQSSSESERACTQAAPGPACLFADM